jgi:hypothetical protein
MASIDALAAAIREALTHIHNLAAQITVSKDLGEQLRNKLSDLGAEGKSEQTSAIIAGLEETQARANNVITQVEAALAAAQALRTGQPRSRSSSEHPAPQTPEPPWKRQPPVAGFTHRKPIAECIEAVRREGWPRNAEGRVSARGYLYTGDGHQVNTETFRPHRKGSSPPCEDLREPWRSDVHYTTTWHAERDAAAEMRRWKLSEAVLYLNVPTCGKESGDPYRCDANLEKILPPTAVMYVWTVHEDGSRSRRRYIGTGEAIDD